jgi:predicted dehydrogenase
MTTPNDAEQHGIDRRDFFGNLSRGAALAGLGLLAAGEAGAAVPRKKVTPVDLHAPKTGGLLKEGETIGLAIVGVGGMGTGHLGEMITREKNGEKVQVRAVADCYTRRQKTAVARVKETTGRDIEAYYDYKKILERDDIHGVIIATPDHWHAQISIDAVNAGKDVYCQKPVTHEIEESLDVRDAVYRTGRVFQCGAQFCSDDFYWQARKFIKNGGIGEVIYAQGDYSRNTKGGPNDRGGEWNWKIDADASPAKSAGDAYIDWETWVGPSRRIPFSPARFFQFRKFWDYSGGIATDLLYHYMAPLIIALDAKAPERATGAGGIWLQKDDREVPDTFFINLDYPDDYSIIFTSSMCNETRNQLMIRGHRGTIFRNDDGSMRVVAEKQFSDWFKKEHGAEEIVVKLEPRDDHFSNWFNCMRNRTECNLPAEIAYRALAGIWMGCESYRQDKVIFWDGEAERFSKKHPRPHRDSKYPANV